MLAADRKCGPTPSVLGSYLSSPFESRRRTLLPHFPIFQSLTQAPSGKCNRRNYWFGQKRNDHCRAASERDTLQTIRQGHLTSAFTGNCAQQDDKKMGASGLLRSQGTQSTQNRTESVSSHDAATGEAFPPGPGARLSGLSICPGANTFLLQFHVMLAASDEVRARAVTGTFAGAAIGPRPPG